MRFCPTAELGSVKLFLSHTWKYVEVKTGYFPFTLIYQWFERYCTPLPSSHYVTPNRDMGLSRLF